MFLRKINHKNFQNKGNTPPLGDFWPYFVIFAQREHFIKNPAKYNCSGPPVFKYQIYGVDWPSNQTKNYSIIISIQKLFNQSAKFIKSFVR